MSLFFPSISKANPRFAPSLGWHKCIQMLGRRWLGCCAAIMFGDIPMHFSLTLVSPARHPYGSGCTCSYELYAKPRPRHHRFLWSFTAVKHSFFEHTQPWDSPFKTLTFHADVGERAMQEEFHLCRLVVTRQLWTRLKPLSKQSEENSCQRLLKQMPFWKTLQAAQLMLAG